MRGLVIAVFAAIVTSSGCVQPPSQAPVEGPADREPASAGVEPPTVAPSSTATTPSAVPPPAVSEPEGLATVPPRPVPMPAAPAATPAAEADTVSASAAAPSAPPEEPRRDEPAPAETSAPLASNSAVDAAEPLPEEAPLAPPEPITAPAAPEPPAALALDLAGLEQRLRQTQAIGVFTKLSLKNQVDDLLGQFRAFYRGQLKVQLTELRQRYELLLFKVLTLLQDADRELADAIAASREAIWGILSDPQKLAQI